MSATTESLLEAFDWKPQPVAAALVRDAVNDFLSNNAAAARLADRMRHETGTRFIDWIDTIWIADADGVEKLTKVGFERQESSGDEIWLHPSGLFPMIRFDQSERRCAIKVDSIEDFSAAHNLNDTIEMVGEPLSPVRRASVARENQTELWVIERHATPIAMEAAELNDEQRRAVLAHGEAFRNRLRDFDNAAEGFAHAKDLAAAAVKDIGVDRACELFFAAEREYWQSRNRAARIQKARQDRLGMGWANHDHHTYRSSREPFSSLIALFEQLGCKCRERFYAGAEAGWGAQVLEQPATGIVIFADVDLAAQEVAGDFAHQDLPPSNELGTVGLWCRLHGEAFLQAGMHHLECQFDYVRAREQLAAEGVQTMPPFTDFPYLKQAFTEGEIWPVEPARLAAAVDDGLITSEQAATFAKRGVLGSHLEILQRDDGYKGFNQTGISEIIRKTDPRRQ